MQVPRLLVALAVAGALLSPALAHRPPAPHFPPTKPFVNAAKSAVEGMTLEEIIQWSDAQFAKRIRWGRYVRYGGVLVVGSALVLSSLNWFYEELQRETNTSLDNWWDLDSAFTHCNKQGGNIYCYSDANRYRVAVTDDTTAAYTDTCADPYRTVVCTRGSSGLTCPGGLLVPSYPSNSRKFNWGDAGVLEWFRTHASGPNCLSRPPLADWLQSHPDAAAGVKQAVTDYIDAQNSEGNIPQTFGEPLPGLTLDPAPTGNQWYDNPFFNPYEDTDGDGWPDWFEWDTGSDPSNAGSQPLPNGDPDGDGYDNASERDAGTDPTDPSSRPDVEQDQDTDGDGLKDSADPCPNDPNNMCEPEEEDPEEIPDPTEPTLTPVELPQLDQPQLPDFSDRFDQVRTNFEENLQTLWDTLQDRFPVGMARWIPAPPSVSGGACEMSFTLQIPDLPTSAQVDLCDSPPMQWAATTGRRLVLASLVVGFLFAVARRASNA